MRRQKCYSHGKYTRASTHSNDDDDEDDSDTEKSSRGGCLRYQKLFRKHQSHDCVRLNETAGGPTGAAAAASATTTIVNNNRDLAAEHAGQHQQQQHQTTLHIINNSFDDDGEIAGESRIHDNDTNGTTNNEEGFGGAAATGDGAHGQRTRKRFHIDLCTARTSWLGPKSSSGDALGAESGYNGRRGFDKLRSWARSNNYSGVS